MIIDNKIQIFIKIQINIKLNLTCLIKMIFKFIKSKF